MPPADAKGDIRVARMPRYKEGNLKQNFDGEPSWAWRLAAASARRPAHPSKPKTPIQGPGGIQAAFAWRAAKDPVEGKTCTAMLVNDVVAY